MKAAPAQEMTFPGEPPRHVWVSRASIRDELTLLLNEHADIELEIGSGKGLFIFRAAQLHTQSYFIGLEIATKFARFAQARLEKNQVRNAQVFCADAMQVLRDEIPSDRLKSVHCYFPDPWWKKRHKKRRVLSEMTLTHIERVLRMGAEFHFWTDVLDYFEETLEIIGRLDNLSPPRFVAEVPAQSDLDYRTHFERRARLQGLPVYRAVFLKND